MRVLSEVHFENRMERGRLSPRQLLSELQAIRTARARAGEDPCYVPFDPKVEAQLNLNRIKKLEARRLRRQRKFMNAATKAIIQDVLGSDILPGKQVLPQEK